MSVEAVPPHVSRRIESGRLRDAWHTVWTHFSLRVGFGLLLALIVFGVAGKALFSDPLDQNLDAIYAPPGSPGHILGTDPLGRDVLSWIASGVVAALVVSGTIVVISALLGGLVGMVAGYFGGVVDSLLMRLVDLWLAVPPLLLFLAASAVITAKGMGTLIALILIVAWLPYARLVRAKVLTDRERGYIAAARLAGASHSRIILVHLLPSASTVILVIASMQIGWVLLAESALSFLGFGLLPPHTSLGFMIAQGRDTLESAWWLVTLPGLAIVMLVLSSSLIGSGLRDVFHLDIETRS